LPTLFDLVSASIKLQKRGSAWWAPCPFHEEKTASFKVSEYRRKQRYHCFGCHAQGDKYDWIMVTRGVDFREAQRILGEEVKPDPAIKAAREAEERRQRAINAYRDRNPDCCCPDWLLAT
jgi:DNA primase